MTLAHAIGFTPGFLHYPECRPNSLVTFFNQSDLAADRTLTLREKQVLGYAELGHSNKLIAYSLGLSTSTVATLLGTAKKKIGLSLDRSEQ